MVILQSRTERGTFRRCDAGCYNGHGARCNCVCGGRNHGVGEEQAIGQTVALLQSATMNLPDGETVQMRLV